MLTELIADGERRIDAGIVPKCIRRACRRISSATLGKKAHFCDRHHIASSTAALASESSTGTTFAGSHEFSPANAGLLCVCVGDWRRSARHGAPSNQWLGMGWGDRMKRREFIRVRGGAAAAWPLAARAQQALPTIGFSNPMTASVESQGVAAFVQRLHAVGWIEGRAAAIRVRWAQRRSERAVEIVAEFVRQKV